MTPRNLHQPHRLRIYLRYVLYLLWEFRWPLVVFWGLVLGGGLLLHAKYHSPETGRLLPFGEACYGVFLIAINVVMHAGGSGVNVNPAHDLVLAAGDELLVVAPIDRLVELEAINRGKPEPVPERRPAGPAIATREIDPLPQPTRG